MVIRHKKYWMRTVPNVGTVSPPFGESQYAPDPLCDYGCFYWHTDKETLTTEPWKELGILNIFISVKFRDFSFGRTGTNDQPSPNILRFNNYLYTNSESTWSDFKNDPDFLQFVKDKNHTIAELEKNTDLAITLMKDFRSSNEPYVTNS